MATFHPLTVKDIRRETADCVSVAFAVPDALRDDFAFKQGQYITLRAELEGEEVRRSYSLCVSPLDGELRVAVKEVPEGRFSTYANRRLQVGDTLEVMVPEGRFFTELNPDHQKHYVAFAAGSGITPIFSIMKTVLETEPESRFTLFYGNQRTDTVIFREAVEALKNTYLNLLSVYYLLSKEHTGSDLFSGRIDRERCRVFLDKLIPVDGVDEFFLCGPEEMTLGIRDELRAHGVPRERIHLELFGTNTGRRKKKQRATTTGDFAAQVSIQLDGNAFSFLITDPDESVLDAALRNGADLPYACKGGVCCTCRARVEEGEATMDVNYALEPDEVAAGYILTCQAHPATDRLRVNFDA